MTKQEFIRENGVNRMPYLVQVLAGRLYDAAFEAGKAEGFRQGVDAVAIKEQEIHRAMYERGAQDATHWAAQRLSWRLASSCGGCTSSESCGSTGLSTRSRRS